MDEKILPVLLVLALSFILIELPHLETGLPMHSDSYDNIAAAQAVLEKGTIFIGDPYAPPQEKSIYYNKQTFYDLQTGFVLILAIVSLIPFITPTTLPVFFPWLVSILAFFATFLLIRKLCRHDFLAFFSSLFIFFIPSNQTMLGPFFITGSSFGLILVPLMLFLGLDYFKENKKGKEFMLSVLFSIFIYPPAVVISIISLVLYALVTREVFEKSMRKLLLLGLGIAAILVVYPMIIYASAGVDFVGDLINYGWEAVAASSDYITDTLILRENALAATPFVPDYLGLPLFLAGLVSILYFGWKEFRKKPNKDFRIIFVPAIVFSIMAFASLMIGRGILVPAERLVFFASFFLLISTGIFLGELVLVLKKILHEKNLFRKKSRNYFSALVLLLLALLIIFSAPVKVSTLQQNIAPNELKALDWIEKNSYVDSFFLAPPYISKPIRVFTGRNVACTSKTRFGCSDELNFLVSSFFFTNCDEKKKILDEYFQADYVLVQKELKIGKNSIKFPAQSCDFLQKTYEEDNVIIYKIESH